MKSILFLGYSNLLKSRILPILSRLGFTSVSIAKYSDQLWDDEYKKYSLSITLFNTIEEGLAKFAGDIVYVSTVNSTHYKYAKMSLMAGFHTVIDKPAVITLCEAQKLVDIAIEKNILLSESTVYLMHPQFSLVKNIFSKYNDLPKLVTLHFSMPPFKQTNFRYVKELGGGAILDTSSYAASFGRFFFQELPISVHTCINEKQEDELDIQYSILMNYSKGRCLIGHFGFNTEYVNQAIIMGTKTNISLNRVFTIPNSLENPISITHENISTIEYSNAGDNFELYFNSIMRQIINKDYLISYNNLLYDAEVRKLIFNNIM